MDGGGAAAPVVVVVGGSGGVGASTLAAALVAVGSATGRAVLVDLDPLGGGADLLVGLDDVAGLRWPALTGTSGPVAGDALADALPTVGGRAVLATARGGGAAASPTLPGGEVVASVLAALRTAYDLVVVDLPRASSAGSRVAAASADRGFLLTDPELRAVAAARAVVAGLPGLDLRVVVRRRAGELTAPDVARALRLPLAARLRPEQRPPDVVDGRWLAGRSGRGPLANLARRLVADLLVSSRVAA